LSAGLVRYAKRIFVIFAKQNARRSVLFFLGIVIYVMSPIVCWIASSGICAESLTISFPTGLAFTRLTVRGLPVRTAGIIEGLMTHIT
jgi:hypothetical protein